jgi:hypothetical protein
MSDPAVPSKPNWGLIVACIVCAIATLIPLWSVKYLPMVDLPQHTAQVSIWIHYHDPAYGFAQQFELNWFTPYLGGYALARFFALFVPILAAMKLVVTLAVLALPLSLLFLLRRTGGDVWWSLAGFPLAFGHCYAWGFFNFLIGIPLCLIFIGLGYSHATKPTRRGAAWLAVLSVLLFFAHFYVLIFGSVVVFFFVLRFTRGLRQITVRMIPLLTSLPLVGVWVWQTLTKGAQPSYGDLWDWGFRRLTDLPGHLFGFPFDGLATGLGVIFLLLLTITLAWPGKLRKDFIIWVPALLAFVIYFFAPHGIFGTQYTYQRFSIFVVTLAFIAENPKVGTPFFRFLRGMFLLALVLGWMTILTFRYMGFNQEAGDFDQIKKVMEPQKKVMALIFDRDSEAVPGPFFLHFANYYQAEKGGSLVFSPAIHFHMLARYKKGMAPPHVRPGFEWEPLAFDGKYQTGYEYFLMRMPKADVAKAYGIPGPFIHSRAGVPVRLLANKGRWFLYESERQDQPKLP